MFNFFKNLFKAAPRQQRLVSLTVVIDMQYKSFFIAYNSGTDPSNPVREVLNSPSEVHEALDKKWRFRASGEPKTVTQQAVAFLERHKELLDEFHQRHIADTWHVFD